MLHHSEAFFIGYFIYLYLKWYLPTWFPFHKFVISFPLPCASMRVLPYLPHLHSIPLRWSIEPPQDQGPPLPLMPDKEILFYICSWSHRSLNVHSLVGGLVLGSSGTSDWLILLFFLLGCKPLKPLQSFPYLLH